METKAVVEEIPSTNTMGREEIVDNVVSNVGRETDSPGARHGENGLDADKLEGLGRLKEALGELKSHMKRALDDTMVSIENELVFTELNMLMTVAREAADRVIEHQHQGSSGPGT